MLETAAALDALAQFEMSYAYGETATTAGLTVAAQVLAGVIAAHVGIVLSFLTLFYGCPYSLPACLRSTQE
jgi:hypothetical protein